MFQATFGMILAVLIALEFHDSILSVLERRDSFVQVRTVVLITLLALARTFIILDAANAITIRSTGRKAQSGATLISPLGFACEGSCASERVHAQLG